METDRLSGGSFVLNVCGMAIGSGLVLLGQVINPFNAAEQIVALGAQGAGWVVAVASSVFAYRTLKLHRADLLQGHVERDKREERLQDMVVNHTKLTQEMRDTLADVRVEMKETRDTMEVVIGKASQGLDAVAREISLCHQLNQRKISG